MSSVTRTVEGMTLVRTGTVSHCRQLVNADALPQAASKWRLLLRMAPRLFKRWSDASRLDAVDAALSTTKHVCRLCDLRRLVTGSVEAQHGT